MDTPEVKIGKTKKSGFLKGFLVGAAIGLIVLVSMFAGAIADRLFVFRPLDALMQRQGIVATNGTTEGTVLLREESAVISVAEDVSPSVVTVAVQTPQRRVLQFDPLQGFRTQLEEGGPRDIGSGFIVSEDGLVITNKHVVDAEGQYIVITDDGETHEVVAIHRDPANDLAILETNIRGYKPVRLGNSDSLRVGQFVIAIGTALGEFRHTVTTGVVSGLGRGIVAGSAFEGFVERLDNVIQTDAAINPGNSGGPLMNAAGEVIGVSVAVARGAENIGFALPVNLVKDGMEHFAQSGTFATKAFLGVEHGMITREAALLNEVPQGAYVSRVLPGSAAESAGIVPGDIIIKIDDKLVTDYEGGLADLISQYSVGDRVTIELWRQLPGQTAGETIVTEATLSSGS